VLDDVVVPHDRAKTLDERMAHVARSRRRGRLGAELRVRGHGDIILLVALLPTARPGTRGAMTADL
jgi:hypothetical protein